MIRYWYRLLNGQFALWHVLLLGTLWIAAGLTLQIVLRKLGGLGLGPALVFYGGGAAHFWLARKALGEQRQLDAMDEDVAVREARLREAAAPVKPPSPKQRPLPTPPRIGDDPFRNPPHTPLVIERPETKASTPPVVAGDPDDGPKILT
jgi:hypothetical protein